VPDTDHEAMRDLIRLRSVLRQVVTRARQHLQGFLLRHGHKHERGTAWRMAYRRWLSTLAFEHPAQQIAFQDYVEAVMDAERRLLAGAYCPSERRWSGLSRILCARP
jgi:transposase